MTCEGNEIECLISQEDCVLEHVLINLSNGSSISVTTADKWAVCIFSKNPKTSVTHYTVVHNKNMKFKSFLGTCSKKYRNEKKKVLFN